jgi:hypothetical protein
MIGVRGVWGISEGLCRPLIGSIAALAVAAQTLLIAFGLTIPARADLATSTFELCLHDAQDAPDEPAGDPGSIAFACAHCIFCFAASHQAAIAAPQAQFQSAEVAIAAVLSPIGGEPLPRLPAHSIAHPRGPPLGA